MAELNQQQHEAVYSDSSKILCLAGAGTGKTYCMIERIWRLVSECSVDPDSILVLTFTNAAAFEMKSRYMNKLARLHSRSVPEFRTFHSFCYLMLSQESDIRSKLGYTTLPTVANPEDEKRMKIEAQLQLGFHLSEKKLSGTVALSESEQFQYETIMKAYKRTMKKNNFITFDSLCYDVCKLFVDGDPLVQKYVDRFKYIFVDEFQDTDDKQYKFVTSFKDSNLFIVGDALQALYSFRGADSSIIKSIADNPLWTVIKLVENYRSSKCICEFANDITTYASDVYRVVIHSDKPGGSVQVKKFDRGYSRKGTIVSDELKACIVSFCKQNEGTIALLCRTNYEVEDIIHILDENKIEYVSNNSEDISEKINVIKSVSDSKFCLAWLSTFLDSYQYTEYIRQSYLVEEYDLNMFLSKFGNLPKIHDMWGKVSAIRKVCLSGSVDKLIEILAIIGIKYVDDYPNVNSLTELVNSMSEKVADSSKVYVGTIHSVKGLEYDNVLVSGVDGPTFPLANEENNNVYYVAATRAKINLLVLKGQ